MIGFMTPLEETRAYKEIAAQATAKLMADMTAKVKAVTAEAKAVTAKAKAEAKEAKAEAKEAQLKGLNKQIQTITQLHETGSLSDSTFDLIMSGLLEQKNKLQ